jgi:hypothetical protein
MKKLAFYTFGLLLITSCQRCYTCTGEITSYYIDPFTGEIKEDAIVDEQEFCGTGKFGTRDALESFERNGYDCVRTD